MRRGRVRGELIEAARGLFATQGIGATSIRGVIQATGANLNSVHYHFGSWSGLVAAVVEEAQEALNRERFERFDALERSGSVDSRSVIAAGYGPLLRQALGPDCDRYREGLLILGQLRFDPGPDGARAMEHYALEFLERIEPLLRRVLPHRPGQLRDAMRFINSAAWDFALRCDVFERIQASASIPRATRRVTERFLDFADAGLLALGPARSDQP